MTEGYEFHDGMKVVQGVPPDAVFITSGFDMQKMEAYLIFMHPSFEPLEIGNEIPRVDVIVEAYANR
jgi:hypothetical protein